MTSNVSVNDHASHTHTYTQVVNHTHGFTDVRGTTTGSQTTAHGFTESNDTSSGFTSPVTGNPSGGVTTGTTAGPSVTLTHTVSSQGTVAWPAGVPTMASYTPAGTINTPSFTGTPFDNRSAGIKAIFCSVN